MTAANHGGDGAFKTPFGTLPRDPEAYRITDHFRYRFTHRRPPEPTGAIVRSCIERGTPKPTQQRDRYLFDDDSLGRTWRLVVGWDADTAEWVAVTIWSPDAHDPDESTPAPL